MEKQDQITDFSYSGIVDAIDGDQKLGQQHLINLILRAKQAEDEVKEAQATLTEKQQKESLMLSGIQRIAQHMKWEFPLHIHAWGRYIKIECDGERMTISDVQTMNIKDGWKPE